MMKPTLPILYSLAAAAPLGPYGLHRRQAATLCDQYGYWSANGYEVNNNNWGRNTASSGSQCTYVDSSDGSGVQWHTIWTWDGSPSNVKSYAYSGRQVARGQKIASIKSMPTSVSWQYNTSDIRANVAYDLFTSEDQDHPSSSGDYELMIWLAKWGDFPPIGSSTGTVAVASQSWDLWVGKETSSDMKVFTFVATSNTANFSADVHDFFDYLVCNQDFPADTQNLLAFELGSEACTGGPAMFTVSQFSASVN
ncbi:concanavalin A-like lectin/glucanase domain-containing protein [Achaetomium macrosporum]|uniref:Concanavalin A-like lectin/glucanase domain-containing protein n=1 Tax=Achaetomium macrosporum TaxID=79813 RepID=A0AAN7H7J5_9PEZI|nr:concanavalin A-like lectin/glucanase domain-containing protein [Achaetomium macrosporum]